jgi:hypothetical protein
MRGSIDAVTTEPRAPAIGGMSARSRARRVVEFGAYRSSGNSASMRAVEPAARVVM